MQKNAEYNQIYPLRKDQKTQQASSTKQKAAPELHGFFRVLTQLNFQFLSTYAYMFVLGLTLRND